MTFYSPTTKVTFQKTGIVALTGNKSYAPVGYHSFNNTAPGCTYAPGEFWVRILKDEFRYSRPTSDHMFCIVKSDTKQGLREAILAVYT